MPSYTLPQHRLHTDLCLSNLYQTSSYFYTNLMLLVAISPLPHIFFQYFWAYFLAFMILFNTTMPLSTKLEPCYIYRFGLQLTASWPIENLTQPI